jgi:predicted SAM-dependent methyltransferase
MFGRGVTALTALRLPITTHGVRQALGTLRREVGIMRAHRRAVAAAARYRDAHGLKLNLGCGPNVKPDWLNIDRRPPALPLDLFEPLPFRDGSCTVIYSEHFLEHVDYPEPAGRLLRECWRVLESGGILSVGVPDTEPLLREYGHGSRYFAQARERWSYPAWCQTELQHINYHFRQNGRHRFAYDYATLGHILTSVGFARVARRQFDPDLDSPAREEGTLYVSAVKP